MKIINLILIVFLLSSCTGNSQEKKDKDKGAQVADQLTRMNRSLVENESKRIDTFIAGKSFKMEKSGTGLRYEIYSHGKGDSTPVAHNLVEVGYKVFLLNGELCYSSDSLGNAKFKLGEGQQINGLEEGVMMMKKGDKARFVMPAHLAYGMSGDQNKIPPSQSVYMEIDLINIKK